MLENVDAVEDKVRKYKPQAVCVVGKGIWDAIYERKHLGRKVGKDFKYGWQVDVLGKDKGWNGARCFVTPSTSGRVAAYSREFQEILWKELGNWVMQEREDQNRSGTVKIEVEEGQKESAPSVKQEVEGGGEALETPIKQEEDQKA
jgi:TDG/mug DNA glycosylase family protein